MLKLLLVPIEDIGGQVGLSNSNLPDAVASGLRIALGLVSILALLGIIIGGITYMVSGDSDQRKKRAKQIISASVIGLIIVFLAWAIVSFVVGSTTNVTTE